MSDKNTVLVLMGIAGDDKPHAARFNAANAITVVKAAQAMNLKVAKAETPEAQALLKKLPEGRLFASGKALVPLVKPDLYDQLLKTLTVAPTNGAKHRAPAPGSAPPPPPEPDPATKAATETLWGAITVGSIVLCWFKWEESSWWEAVVTAVSKDGGTLTCRWRDYPAEKPITVKRHAVALIGPGVKA